MIEKKPKIVKKSVKSPLIDGKDNEEFANVVIKSDKLSDLEWFALQAYVLNPNATLLWRCIRPTDGLSAGTIMSRAKGWLENGYVKDAIKAIQKNLSGNGYLSLKDVKKIEKEREGGDEDVELDREKLIKAINKRIIQSSYNDKEAIDTLLKMKQDWRTSDNSDSDEELYSRTIHLFLPHTCNQCNRFNSPVCNGCSLQREMADDLNDDERKWIQEHDAD